MLEQGGATSGAAVGASARPLPRDAGQARADPTALPLLINEVHRQASSSTLLGSGEGGGEPVEGDGLAAEGAGAEDEGEHDLQFVQDLVEGHPGAGAFGSVRIMVQKAWARDVTRPWCPGRRRAAQRS